MPNLEQYDSIMVVLGDFNPAIFTPDWLLKNELIGSNDADIARTSESIVMSHQITRFETEWFALQVTEQQFHLASKGPLLEIAKDLVLGIFTLLTHTPIRAIGINFAAHYKMDSEDDYQKIGNVLAPKDIWYDLFSKDSNHCGMESLSIRIQAQKTTEKDSLLEGSKKLFTIQPSSQVDRGVYFLLNEHFTIQAVEKDAKTAAEKITQLLTENWPKLFTESKTYFESILSKALAK